jgi:hypothetical protein
MTYDDMTPEQRQQFDAIETQLAKNFPARYVAWKPQATSGDRAQAVCFVDPRRYEDRLDAVCPGWQRSYPFVAQDGSKVVCRLTIMGITREACGEAEATEKNKLTSSEAQSFKRACEAFRLGRQFYYIEAPWVAYDPDKKKLKVPPQLPDFYLKNCFDVETSPAAEKKQAAVHNETAVQTATGAIALSTTSATPKRSVTATVCAICQQEIVGGLAANGKQFAVKELCDVSVKKVGAPLCYNHFRAAREALAEISLNGATMDESFAIIRRILLGEVSVAQVKTMLAAGKTIAEVLA